MNPGDKSGEWPEARPQPDSPAPEERLAGMPRNLQAEFDAAQYDDDEEDKSPLFTTSRIYMASANRKRPEGLILLCATAPAQIPTYAHLLNITVEADFQTDFTLMYPFFKVRVKGQRLLPIVHAINTRRCAILREFHPDRYDMPRNREASFIESIEIEPL